MSLSWMAAHGDVPSDAPHAAPAWACTGCHACRPSCDHQNPVAEVLFDSRHALARAGALPAAARRVLDGFAAHEAATALAVRHLEPGGARSRGAPRPMLVGCRYVRAAPGEARDAVDAATALVEGPVALIDRCCGLPLRLAGDRDAFTRHAAAFAGSLRDAESLLVVDPGCAAALRQMYPAAGVALAPAVELLVELAHRRLASLRPLDAGPAPVRWRDPCQLGRGLGLYDPPRAVLARIIGRPPDELPDRREVAPCSGAGGLLPTTMPEVASAIADALLRDHVASGGGRLVTACASSLLALRARAPAAVPVDDLVTWVARATRAG
jgi:Fe-S oxidoreductase